MITILFLSSIEYQVSRILSLMVQYSTDNRQGATDIGYQEILQEIMDMPVRFFVQYLDYWICITVIIDLKE